MMIQMGSVWNRRLRLQTTALNRFRMSVGARTILLLVLRFSFCSALLRDMGL